MSDTDQPTSERAQERPAAAPRGFPSRRMTSASRRRRRCPLAGQEVDYKNIAALKPFLSERGRMLPRRVTAISAKKQRELSVAIKRARILALLPFVTL